MTLNQVQTREEAIDVLEGYSSERKEEIDELRTRRPLVKSYMLETVPPNLAQPSLHEVFKRAGAQLQQLDETLFKVRDLGSGETRGLLEYFDRHPVIYTDRKSQEMDGWVRRLVQLNPEVDSLWLSGVAFTALLEVVCETYPAHRFGRIVFNYEGLYENASPSLSGSQEEPDEEEEAAYKLSETAPAGADDDDVFIPERRSTRFMVVDRLGELKTKLPRLRAYYAPLHAIAQLRIPAHGPGGHDFYYWGKATNRSTSFANHRQNVMYVLNLYRHATQVTEQTAWSGVEKTTLDIQGEQRVLIGAPVTLEFSEPLSQTAFDNFIQSTFHRENNPFRLWGNPIKLGPRKVHVYGLDRHLWQPLHLEITDKRIIAILPAGTCGNSIHRLVTNVQQFLDPNIRVWIGDRPYKDLISGKPSEPTHVH